jgi:hypothetical protein
MCGRRPCEERERCVCMCMGDVGIDIAETIYIYLWKKNLWKYICIWKNIYERKGKGGHAMWKKNNI